MLPVFSRSVSYESSSDECATSAPSSEWVRAHGEKEAPELPDLGCCDLGGAAEASHRNRTQDGFEEKLKRKVSTEGSIGLTDGFFGRDFAG